jgi:hypothetical protein
MANTTAGPAPTLAGRSESRKPILITVHEVLLSTAAALKPRRTKVRRDHPTKVRHDYPAHYAYLERALMAREMERL